MSNADSNYTGPVTIIEFNGPKDSFFLTLHVEAEDLASIEGIAARFAEDGYKPNLKVIRKWRTINGTLEDREPRFSLGFRRSSAFIRA